MIFSPPLVLAHPRIPGVELHRGPRSGESYLIAMAVRLDGEDLVDVGEWLAQRGREELDRQER
ncbi:hypothetical protein [Streptosporangium sp. CA-115845]|uniref:hypothetical protein n=1 Tax=Streptosporangium sp. CA-115845 TaxID=3240071 RepID=UPI003D8B9319